MFIRGLPYPAAFNGGTITTAQTIQVDNVSTAQTPGLTIVNTTPAGAGAQQYSPMLVLTGYGWKTDATAGSRETDWAIQNQPVQGTALPSTNLVFLSQINGGGYTARMTLTSAGVLTAAQFNTTGTAPVVVGGNATYTVQINKTAGGIGFFKDDTTTRQGYLAYAADSVFQVVTDVPLLYIYAGAGIAAEFQRQADIVNEATSLLLSVKHGGVVTQPNVVLGAADSGGTGFKVLRVVN
jgi:hypothetical protein